MFDVELYTCTSDDRVVDKAITLVGTVQGELRENSGILYPTIRFQFDSIPTFNYVKIPAFGNRYYFVDGEPVTTSYNIWDVTFRHDPLMNLKSQFRELEGIISRQENVNNPYLMDSNAPIQVTYDVVAAKLLYNSDECIKFDEEGKYVVVMMSSKCHDNSSEEENV